MNGTIASAPRATTARGSGAFCPEGCGRWLSREAWGFCDCPAAIADLEETGEADRQLVALGLLNVAEDVALQLGADVALLQRAHLLQRRHGADPRLAHLFTQAARAGHRVVRRLVLAVPSDVVHGIAVDVLRAVTAVLHGVQTCAAGAFAAAADRAPHRTIARVAPLTGSVTACAPPRRVPGATT